MQVSAEGSNVENLISNFVRAFQNQRTDEARTRQRTRHGRTSSEFRRDAPLAQEKSGHPTPLSRLGRPQQQTALGRKPSARADARRAASPVATRDGQSHCQVGPQQRRGAAPRATGRWAPPLLHQKAGSHSVGGERPSVWSPLLLLPSSYVFFFFSRGIVRAQALTPSHLT